VEPALFPLDALEETIQVAHLGDVSLHPRRVMSDLLNCGGQLHFTATSDEDVGAFLHKLLCGGQADPTTATSDQCNLSRELGHRLSSNLRLSAPPNGTISRTCVSLANLLTLSMIGKKAENTLELEDPRESCSLL